MLLLGIDVGTSSIKVTVVDSATGKILASAQHPETETGIIAPQSGWAEQSPDGWWEDVKQAVLKCHASEAYHPSDIGAIGIAYQMHGLVLVDKDQHILRNSIIWCDSRAVDIGNKAFARIGEQHCLSHLLNSPGNFTASKLAWVKEHEPAIYEKADKVMLPGDFIAMKLTGEATTTISALSEGIFWDFLENDISQDVLQYFGFNRKMFPAVKPLFSPHGYLKENVAVRLNLKKGIPVSYKSGDQPNNALALNVLEPGQVATTAGTSGVIYAVSDQLTYDPQSRVNSFAHVNYTPASVRTGILLCINGAGIFNRWIKQISGSHLTYANMNEAAAQVSAGCEGLFALPFG
ncbi:MAG TPA: FGGY family carbohydrate kinase, partial [Chitinophagaceae bacterium]|nr:FGGY family carbohydrate kinase [Chitinophagaceae bacterium]